MIEIAVELTYGGQNEFSSQDGNQDSASALGKLSTVITDFGKGIPENKMAGLFETFSILKSGLK